MSPFGGVTYKRDKDGKRLWTQLQAVRDLMIDGKWRTLPESAVSVRQYYRVKASEASISARIRDLRKERFGGYVVERKRLSAGLWAYRIKP
jgi:hypothetical protein